MIKLKKLAAVVASCVMMTSVFAFNASATTAESIPAETSISAAAAYTPGTYRIICDALNIRQSPSTFSPSLGLIFNGNTVNVSGVIHNGTDYWGRVTYNGISGYICLAPSYVNQIGS